MAPSFLSLFERFLFTECCQSDNLKKIFFPTILSKFWKTYYAVIYYAVIYALAG